MPRGDRTGPAGMGPMTGRGAGYCTGQGAPGFLNPNYGRGGMGYGARGRGRGWRHWYHATGLTGWQRGAGGVPVGWGFAPPFGGELPPGYGPEYGPGYSQEAELRFLHDQVKSMEGGLEAARERLAELEKEAQGDAPGEDS
jgi:hypothetical protein